MAKFKGKSVVLAGLALGAASFFRKQENRSKVMEFFNEAKSMSSAYNNEQKENDESTTDDNIKRVEDIAGEVAQTAASTNRTKINANEFVGEGGAQQAIQVYNEEDARTYLTRCIRLSHPKVVVTQDLNGEYGHGQHMFLANNVVNAVDLAADATYDAESLEKYGAWEVDKFYIHIYPENQINLDMRIPLDSFDGKITPLL